MIIAFHKPYGVLSQFTPDQPGQKTLADFAFPKNVYPVGRLDMDSEGLLLLTDETPVTDLLLNPKNAHPRTYLVQVEGNPDHHTLKKLSSGTIVIQNHHCLPCQANIPSPQPTIPPRDPPIRVRKNIPETWITLRLTEGKNRQVRRMTAAAGHPTLRLIRTAISDLQLGSQAPGHWHPLTETDRQLLHLPFR